jgi:large conductance mechanosensitive channel
VIIGAAFGKIVTTLVEGVIMPPFGLLLNRVDFASLFWTLDTSKGVPQSLAEAKTKGIPVVTYGQLVNDVIAFLIVAFVVFLLVKQVNKLKDAVEHQKEDAPPSTRACPFCLSSVNVKATRCPACTSQLA